MKLEDYLSQLGPDMKGIIHWFNAKGMALEPGKITQGWENYCEKIYRCLLPPVGISEAPIYYYDEFLDERYTEISHKDNERFALMRTKQLGASNVFVVAIFGQSSLHDYLSNAMSSYMENPEVNSRYLGITTMLERNVNDPRLMKSIVTVEEFDGWARSFGLSKSIIIKNSQLDLHKHESIISNLLREKGYALPNAENNLGTFVNTEERANAEIMRAMRAKTLYPRIIYTFKEKSIAEKALLKMPFIQKSHQSDNLIANKVIVFGLYKVKSGEVEALIAGYDLTKEMWGQAQESFVKHGGKKIIEVKPTPQKISTRGLTKNITEVVFVKEVKERITAYQMGIFSDQNPVVESIYRLYRAENAASALDFLKTHPVDRHHLYIVVETPEGNYGRDINGIYKEP